MKALKQKRTLDMDYTGTMLMDTDWPWIDWINDVWPMTRADTPEAIFAACLLAFIAVWWGFWNDRV
ncbi:MAG: hypothetical protein GVY29_03815 [Spirochaetes bacterium]|jgi:hypothetical protein|nr:hypothetical protein [Spirochaetota bacterium]